VNLKIVIGNPYSYLWSMATRQALDLVEERANMREAVEALTVPAIQKEFIETRAATILIEGLVEEVEADVSWAAEVVAIAISRLRPALRRAITYVVANGTDCDAKTAAVALGTTDVTFRANKSKGYEMLRALIPVVIAEKGIVLPSPRLVEVFTERHDFGEDDD
jgi:DNA-directed RNA polymerase specialized sigma24 family protein